MWLAIRGRILSNHSPDLISGIPRSADAYIMVTTADGDAVKYTGPMRVKKGAVRMQHVDSDYSENSGTLEVVVFDSRYVRP